MSLAILLSTCSRTELKKNDLLVGFREPAKHLKGIVVVNKILYGDYGVIANLQLNQYDDKATI